MGTAACYNVHSIVNQLITLFGSPLDSAAVDILYDRYREEDHDVPYSFKGAAPPTKFELKTQLR